MAEGDGGEKPKRIPWQPKKKGGPPPTAPYDPPQDMRDMVKLCIGFGIPAEQINRIVRHPKTGRAIPKATFERVFAEEMETGVAAMDAIVSSSLAKSIRQGNVTAMIWYMKNRMGWRDAWDINSTRTERVVVDIDITELAKKMEQRGLPLDLFGAELPVLEAPTQLTNRQQKTNGGGDGSE